MKLLFTVCAVILSIGLIAQPCTTNDGTGCVCENGGNDCDLLPDITISWDALQNYSSGPDEYSQTGNGVNNGRLRITGSTPNIGYGSFTVRGTDYYICGTDTIYDPTGNPTCSNGSVPTNILKQRIYHKDSLGTITYWDRWAGGQTYHPTHGHNHVDDWVTFTLRIPDASEPDTLQWQIIGDGAKIGFCLMDFGSCNFYNGHCRDNQSYNSGTILTSSNIPNYGFGGGGYNCSPIEQGISVGFTDIYSKSLDGMWINIPPGTCNGDYWIVAEVDPRNNFLESNETNNWTAIPYTLTLQEDSSTTAISVLGSSTICSGIPVELKANTSNSYLWSTGDTTQSIFIDSAGYFAVTTNNLCGTAHSDTLEIIAVSPTKPLTTEDSHCGPGILNLTATGTGDLHWFENYTNDSIIYSGNLYTTALLNITDTFFVSNDTLIQNAAVFSMPYNNAIGSGGNYTGTQWLFFDVNENVLLKSVKVYASGTGNRTLQILDKFGTQIHIGTFTIPDGESRVNLNWNLNQGTDYTFRIVGIPNLFRNNGGVNYPYHDQNNLVSIKNSSAGAAYYYFFYDWEVKAPDMYCLSEKTPVNATINLIPSVEFTNVLHTVCGFSNGGAEAIVSLGNGPYIYNWSNGSTMQSISNVSPGNYLVTIADSNTCSITDTVSIIGLADVIITSSKKNVSCSGGNDGNASLIMSGNAAPYNVQWNTTPVNTTNVLSNLTGGNYTATITDSNGCYKEITLEVREPSPLTVFAIPNNPSPVGSSNGSINLLVSGGVAPYTYNWSTGANTEDLINIPAGTYYVTAIDRNGCAEFAMIIIN